MSKTEWKPGNMLYPLPAVIVSCGSNPKDYNMVTVAWAGTICTNPPMLSISLRPSRHSYSLIKNSGEFVVNLTTEAMVKATDYCGVKSGRDVNKFAETKLTPEAAKYVKCPLIKESPVNIECKVVEIKELGSHDLFIAKVLSIHVDDSLIDSSDKFHFNNSKPLCYSHGNYYGLGKYLGHFGYSVKKNTSKKNNRKK